MSIQSTRQLENTRGKLQMLERRLEELEAEAVVNPETRALTRRSLKKLAIQLKEEIARFESRTSVPVGWDLIRHPDHPALRLLGQEGQSRGVVEEAGVLSGNSGDTMECERGDIAHVGRNSLCPEWQEGGGHSYRSLRKELNFWSGWPEEIMESGPGGVRLLGPFHRSRRALEHRDHARQGVGSNGGTPEPRP